MSSDDEVDYMSEEFLNHCVGKDDFRPGLLSTYSNKRKIHMERKKKILDEKYRKKMKPVHEMQKEKLKEGLETPIDTSNKGFALMQKMGYKSGMSLGKEGNGIIEPVGIVIKSDRIGIGWQELLKEKRKKRAETRKRKEMDPLEYRAHKSNQHYQKKIDSDLMKSRKVCYNLDCREGNTNPHEYWFWPEHTWENDDDNAEDDDYNDNEDECSKVTEENDPQSGDKNSKKTSEEESDDNLENHEQLQVLTYYLRSTYFYCVWCFTEYESLEDLETNCPGTSRQDHDD